LALWKYPAGVYRRWNDRAYGAGSDNGRGKYILAGRT